MPLQKNQLLTLRIERLSSDGSGVAIKKFVSPLSKSLI